jgi:hypothetical protein
MLKAEAEATRVATIASFILIIVEVLNVNNEVDCEMQSTSWLEKARDEQASALRCRRKEAEGDLLCLTIYFNINMKGEVFHSNQSRQLLRKGFV